MNTNEHELNKVRKSRNWGCIIASLFLIAFFLAIVFVLPNFLEFKEISPLEHTKHDMRSLATAIESHSVDHDRYPLWAVGSEGVNSFLPKASRAFSVPTFRRLILDDENGGSASLTSPVAYISALPKDRYFYPKDSKGAIYSYYSDENGWIIVSPGPDRVYDINPQEDYDSSIAQPSEKILLKSYDSSNGTKSSGDVWKSRQGMSGW